MLKHWRNASQGTQPRFLSYHFYQSPPTKSFNVHPTLIFSYSSFLIHSLNSNFPFTGITRETQGLEKRTELKGWNVDRTRTKIGTGDAAYKRASQAILSWQNIDLDWFFTNSPPVKPGNPVVVTTNTLGLWSLLPLQVTWYDKDSAKRDGELKRRVAFGHCTMDGHQLAGEESFAVELMKNGDVIYEAVLVSKPASLLSIVSTPMLRFFQIKFMAESVSAMKKAAAGV
jgi:uncharacterized protein (UPF0548 family)